MFLKYPIICSHVYYYSNKSLPPLLRHYKHWEVQLWACEDERMAPSTVVGYNVDVLNYNIGSFTKCVVSSKTKTYEYELPSPIFKWVREKSNKITLQNNHSYNTFTIWWHLFLMNKYWSTFGQDVENCILRLCIDHVLSDAEKFANPHGLLWECLWINLHTKWSVNECKHMT